MKWWIETRDVVRWWVDGKVVYPKVLQSAERVEWCLVRSFSLWLVDGCGESERAKAIDRVMQVQSFPSPQPFSFLLQVLPSQVGGSYSAFTLLLTLLFHSIPFHSLLFSHSQFSILLQPWCSHPSPTQNGE